MRNQTRRRFGGRHPLCGIGVTSLIIVIFRPQLAIARSASPDPNRGLDEDADGLHAVIIALRAASSATSCAAKGVALRLPLKPFTPPLDHETVLPLGSVMVTMVLLKVAWM